MTDKNTEPDTPLPFADRPVATAPGHWVLARAGKRVLRPGGAALSRAMLDHARIAHADVVELAPGMGRTAVEIIRRGPGSYTAIDQDPRAVQRVTAIIGGKGVCRQGEAASTGLDDGCSDVVVGEAMLTMQGDRGKQAIVHEAARILRPGGRYAIHELGVRPDDIDETLCTEMRQGLARAIHVNARPMTAAAWRSLMADAGLVVDWLDTAPMALLKPRRNIEDEGWSGVLRIVRNVMGDKQLRQRIRTMAKTFRAYEDSMCGIAVVAHKPQEG
ncbi:class I SAM-dependent methyltransferase [uncultured Propionibacterium sp.]|uniref:class I SAM-dependent methyltransferase n=1 Tax=uncultured Propionibacterium sp. TaxID=218066 RepID=UPI00292E46B3|nr:class I SAM-dependent methyltransferase [uncultured Propionibacterium sp.]